MLDLLLAPLNYGFVTRALGAGILIGCICGFLSTFLILKGWSLMGDAMAHSVVPGVVLGYIVGLPFVAGAFFTGLLASYSMSFVKQRTKLKEDAIIGVVFTSFFAFGLLLISIFPTQISLKSIILGNILSISDFDIFQVILVSILTLIILAGTWKTLCLVFFDESYARCLGINIRLYKALFFTLLSAATVTALTTVGACLVVAMLIIPGCFAYLLTDRFGVLIILSSLFGAFTSVLGIYISYFMGGATGGVIVLCQFIIFLITFIVAPKYGLWGRYIASKNAIGDL